MEWLIHALDHNNFTSYRGKDVTVLRQITVARSENHGGEFTYGATSSGEEETVLQQITMARPKSHFGEINEFIRDDALHSFEITSIELEVSKLWAFRECPCLF